MGQTLANFNSVLKIHYLGPITDLLENSSLISKHIKKTSKYTQGRHAYFPIHTGRNQRGIGASRTGTLPTAGNQQFSQATFRLEQMYGTIEVDGPTIDLSRSNYGAFAHALHEEIVGIARDCAKDMNRTFWSDGTGRLSDTNTTTNSTTMNVINPRMIKNGMFVDVRARATGTAVSGGTNVQVTNVDTANNTVTLAAAVTTNSTHSVYRTGNRNQEIYGMLAAINDVNIGNGRENFGNIDRSATSIWRSNVVSNPLAAGTLREIDLPIVQGVFDQIEIESGYGSPTLIVTNHATRLKYAQIFLGLRRYPEGPSKFEGGWMEGLSFNGAPLYADVDAYVPDSKTLNRLYFIDLDSFCLLESEDGWNWGDRDGAILSRVSGQDNYSGFLYKYCNMACNHPRRNAVLKDVQE